MSETKAKPIFSEPQKHINDDSANNNTKLSFFQMTKAFKRLTKHASKFNHVMMQAGVVVEDGEEDVIAIFETFFFKKLNEIVDSHPPLSLEKFTQRFGNIAVRSIHDELGSKSTEILQGLLDSLAENRKSRPGSAEYEHNPEFLKESIVEVSHYFLNSFGNRERMDFGTGHELSFIAFLSIFEMLHLLEFKTHTLKTVFKKYYTLVKKLILDYNLEPAGSHGVWGLDDNFHFSYILGSAQMIQNPLCKPSECLKYARDHTSTCTIDHNFLVWNLQFIGEVKNYKNFKEHSPMLNDILSSVADWRKINKGLYKMWIDEVLLKFPVIQHFKFGTYFFPWKLTRKSKKEIKSIRSESKEAEKSSLLRYRMNQITVDQLINPAESGAQHGKQVSQNRRLFPMNPPKRTSPVNR